MENIKFNKKEETIYQLKIDEVTEVINDLPHQLVRVTITGDYFPHRAKEPFVRILRSNDQYELCWFANVSEDQRSIHAYFLKGTKMSNLVDFGYGNEICGQINVKVEEGGLIEHLGEISIKDKLRKVDRGYVDNPFKRDKDIKRPFKGFTD